MLLTVAYIQQVLNQHPADVVFSPTAYAQVLEAFHMELKAGETPIVSRMKLYAFPGGYQGVLDHLAALTTQRDELAGKVAELTKQLEEATAPVAVHA
jgi:hypothetical protein